MKNNFLPKEEKEEGRMALEVEDEQIVWPGGSRLAVKTMIMRMSISPMMMLMTIMVLIIMVMTMMSPMMMLMTTKREATTRKRTTLVIDNDFNDHNMDGW